MPRDNFHDPGAEHREVHLEHIDANPHRDFTETPVADDVIEAAMQFYRSHGRWPNLPVGRQIGDKRVQLAYGHRFLEAAKRLDHTVIPMRVAELTDADMLLLMPTVGGEHSRQQPEVCIDTWMKVRAQNLAQTSTEIARLLGWVRDDPRRPGRPRLSYVANACHWAEQAIVGGKAELSDFVGMANYQIVAESKIKLGRVGTKWFVDFVPEEQRGIRKRTVIEAKPPLHSMSAPLRYAFRPDIGNLQCDTETLVMMINRLLSRGYATEHNGKYIELVAGHLDDLLRSFRKHMTQPSAQEEYLRDKVIAALEQLAERALNYKRLLKDSCNPATEFDFDEPEGDEAP